MMGGLGWFGLGWVFGWGWRGAMLCHAMLCHDDRAVGGGGGLLLLDKEGGGSKDEGFEGMIEYLLRIWHGALCFVSLFLMMLAASD